MSEDHVNAFIHTHLLRRRIVRSRTENGVYSLHSIPTIANGRVDFQTRVIPTAMIWYTLTVDGSKHCLFHVLETPFLK